MMLYKMTEVPGGTAPARSSGGGGGGAHDGNGVLSIV